MFKKKQAIILLTFVVLLANALQSQGIKVFSNGSLHVSPASNMHVGGDIVVARDGNLTISSDATNSGSLIVTGTVTGDISYQRQIPSTNWHFVAAPVTTQNIQTFALEGTNGIPKNGTNNYGISVYNNENATGERWDYYNDSASGQDLSITDAGNFTNGIGYSMLRNTTGLYIFNGNMAVTDVLVPLRTVNSHKWNLIGNPYPSFLPANNAANATNILSLNLANLDENFAYLLFWTGNAYEERNLADGVAFYLAPGQAFLVDPKNDNVTFTFPESQQTAQVTSTETLLKIKPIPEITVHLESNGITETTRLKYFSNTTKGLDIGYDAGTYIDATPIFAIDTHLVTNSKGVHFTLQCLPNSDFETSIVPLAITAKTNKSITFSATAVNLPEGIKVFLEDTATNTITDITTASYQITTDQALTGIGRFYLHTAENVLSKENNSFASNFSMYKTSNTNLRIVGLQTGGNAVLKMHSIIGKQVLLHSFKMETVNNIDLPNNLAKGIYLIQVVANGIKQTEKLIIE